MQKVANQLPSPKDKRRTDVAYQTKHTKEHNNEIMGSRSEYIIHYPERQLEYLHSVIAIAVRTYIYSHLYRLQFF